MDIEVIFCANFLGLLTIQPALMFSLESLIPAIPVLFVTLYSSENSDSVPRTFLKASKTKSV